MAMVRGSNETIRKRVEINSEFLRALLSEALELTFGGDEKTARMLLRHLVNEPARLERLAGGMELYSDQLRRKLALSWR